MTQFYLGTWTGAGTDASPFVPVGAVGNWSVIDLRPDSTVTTGRCILALPDGSANPSGATALGTNLDAVLTTAQTNAINTALGSTLPLGLTRRQAIQNLLLTPPVGKWGKLANTRLPDGSFRTQIALAGQLLLDQPVVAGGAGPFTESFTHANQQTWANIDLTWTDVLSNTAVGITSNQGAKSGATPGNATDMRAGNDASGNDNEVRVDAAVMANATAATISGYARYQSAANTAYEFRRAGNTALSTYTVAIFKRVTGTATSLSSATLARAATGTSEQIFGTVSGSTLTLYIDGVQKLQITDTAITTGTRGGIRLGTNTALVVDNYKFGDLGTTGTTTVTGTLAQTTAASTSTASGSEVTGTLAQTTAASTSAASGGTGPSGTVAQTTAASTSAAAGSTVTGTLARTTDASTSAASGASGAAGSLAQTTADATSSASGGTGPAGTLARSTDASTSTASGSSTTGALAVTTEHATGAASGTADPPTPLVTGALAVTLANAIASAAGSSVVGMAITITEAAIALATGTASLPTVHYPVDLTVTVSDPWTVELAVVDISDPTPTPASVSLTVTDLDDLVLAVTDPWTLTVGES